MYKDMYVCANEKWNVKYRYGEIRVNTVECIPFGAHNIRKYYFNIW